MNEEQIKDNNEEELRRKKMNARLFWLLSFLVLASVGYLVYQLVTIFSK